MAESKHPANIIHPHYLADREARALSLALKEGTPAFRRDSKRGQRKWMRPAEGELESEHSEGYRHGMAVFDRRMEYYRTSNDYGDSLRTSATQPFDYVPTFESWDPATKSRLLGEGIGLDGAGSSLKDEHAQAYGEKLFAGIHHIRVTVANGVPLWVQTPADSLLNWRVALTADGRVLVYALVESTDDSGALLRTTYELTPGGVVWATYRSVTKTPTLGSLRVQLTQHEWEPVGTDVMKGLWSVPIEPFAMFWNTPYRSPVPFADAAEIQLSADIHESLLGSYRRRVSNSPAFVVSEGDPSSSAGGPGYGATRTVDENAQPRPLKTSGGAVRLGSDQARARWESLDTSHIPQETEKLEKEYEKVRRKCQDPLLATYRGGPATATEVAVTDARSMSWLRLSVLADVRSLRRLAGYTAYMTGSSPDGEILIRIPKSSKQKADLVDRVEKQYESGAVGKRVVWKVCAENLEGYPTEAEVEDLSAPDEPPDPPPTPVAEPPAAP